MKKTIITILVASLVFLSGTGTVSAQDDGMKIIPVEMYACTYNDRKGPEDLDKFAEDWNEWADDTGMDTYAAWTLTPFYYGPNQEFDFIWLGAGKTATDLGKEQDAWLTNPNGLNDDVQELSTCAAHTNFASLNFKAPPDGATPATSVLTFSDCTYKDGATFNAVRAAMRDWSQYLADAGSATAIWAWYPVYGGGGEEFEFKWLQAHESMEAMGAEYDLMASGAVFKRNQLISHLLDCDSARVYVAQSRRFVQLR
jgi:hypothetical protein